MKTYLNIDTARNDGNPHNSGLRIALEMNRLGFVLESAVMQHGLADSPVVIAQVIVPQDFKRLLPRLARKLACNIVLHREPGEPPRPRAWRVTPDGLFLISHND